MGITKEDLQLIWHTKTCYAFANLNFDKIIDYNNIESLEEYIIVNKQHIDGYVAKKTHSDSKIPTLYFIPSDIIKELPIIPSEPVKVKSKGKIFYLVGLHETHRIEPEHIWDWTTLIDYSGIPYHSNKMHHTLYKNKCLYGRTAEQFYHRTVTESAFGKDKYKESLRHLFGSMKMISDPSVANIFYAASHNKDITICELPDDGDKKEFNRLANQLMRIGDGTNKVDNRARATEGTSDYADTSELSVSFIHNVPEYYLDAGMRSFEQIWPYNVVNRYYYNLYDGFLEAKFPDNMDHEELAKKYTTFYQNFIKSALWYQENWTKLQNRYPNVSLLEYTFPKKEPRFKDHFISFAKCLSHYAKTEEIYIRMLKAEYASHQKYRNLIYDIKEEVKDISAFETKK